MFYSLMAAVEDDADVQRRGSVYVFNFLGGHTSNLQPPTPQNLRMPKQFHTCLPRRIAAMHAIYDDAALGPFLIVLALILPKLQAIRFRSHFGTFYSNKVGSRGVWFVQLTLRDFFLTLTCCPQRFTSRRDVRTTVLWYSG